MKLVSILVFRLIANATASPICQFVPSPGTFLHSVDPRIKLVWVVALVVLPARSHIMMRFGLVVYLAFLSIWILPRHLWMDQLGRVSLLSGILFIMLGLGSDGAPALVQSKTPPAAMMGLPSLPASFMSYSYLIMKLGPLQFTRKGLSVASTAACLTFTIFQSASLCLTTTSPEQLAFALRWYLIPLTYVGVPVDEIILTLLLSLRFIHIVFDELRNVALGIVSRRINWVQLTMMETIDIFIGYIQRIFKNIFNHAEQISQAMIVRGFRGNSCSHKIYFLSGSSNATSNVISLERKTIWHGPASILKPVSEHIQDPAHVHCLLSFSGSAPRCSMAADLRWRSPILPPPLSISATAADLAPADSSLCFLPPLSLSLCFVFSLWPVYYLRRRPLGSCQITAQVNSER
ncbi:hypothetical protein CRG98_031657 [Punica granatum]|uniref:Protein ABCI12, chloroplastic n=1 Tax=Punica granatum TaxID=22663 RepID=A0A2I0IW69_PUNGR|nr:hypothetical protein CRG98_031657 [Punica granatum]